MPQSSTNRARPLVAITDDDVSMIMQVSTVNHLLLRPEISSKQIDRAEEVQKDLIPLALRLRPGLENTRNIHHSTHIPDDCRHHGPVNNHWTFGGERIGKEYKGYNTNGKSIESTVITARLSSVGSGERRSRERPKTNGGNERCLPPPLKRDIELGPDVSGRRSPFAGVYFRRSNGYGSMLAASSFFAFLPGLRRRRVLGARRYLSIRLRRR